MLSFVHSGCRCREYILLYCRCHMYVISRFVRGRDVLSRCRLLDYVLSGCSCCGYFHLRRRYRVLIHLRCICAMYDLLRYGFWSRFLGPRSFGMLSYITFCRSADINCTISCTSLGGCPFPLSLLVLWSLY